MLAKNRKLLAALTFRQLIFLVVISAAAGAHLAITGNWIGWPSIVVSAVVVNVAWGFVV